MTILVGISCDDGVVIGTDSSATFAPGSAPELKTVEQPATKLFVCGSMLCAISGDVGLGQRFIEIAKATPSTTSKNPWEIAKGLCKSTLEDFNQSYAEPRLTALVGFGGQGKSVNLFEFSGARFQPELKTGDLWFVSAGSGQLIVDPFLALLRQSFFENKRPRLREAIFACVWAIQLAIEINPGGINGPMQIGTVEFNEKFYAPKILDASEVAEHINNVSGVLDHLADYRRKLSGEVNGTSSAPPSP